MKGKKAKIMRHVKKKTDKNPLNEDQSIFNLFFSCMYKATCLGKGFHRWELSILLLSLDGQYGNIQLYTVVSLCQRTDEHYYILV